MGSHIQDGSHLVPFQPLFSRSLPSFEFFRRAKDGGGLVWLGWEGRWVIPAKVNFKALFGLSVLQIEVFRIAAIAVASVNHLPHLILRVLTIVRSDVEPPVSF